MHNKFVGNRRRIFFLILYLIGILHWVLFMKLGEPTWKTFDWMGTHQMIYSVINKSISTKMIPFHFTGFDVPIIGNPITTGSNGSYDIRWFSMGGPNISPQLFIFSLFNVPTAMLLNLIFYYSIGFWGIYLWIVHFNLSYLSSSILFLMLSFNGSIVSKLGVGQLGSCNAYLFIPLFLYILYKFISEENTNTKQMINITLLFVLFIFFTKLNGNGQNVYQFLLISSVVIIFYPKKILWFILFLILSFISMTFYIVPTYLFSSYISHDRQIFGGYGFQSGDSGIPLIDVNNASNIIESVVYHFINIFYHLWEGLTVSFTSANDATWEFNLYIGKFGLIFIFVSITFLILKRRNDFKVKEHRYIFPAIIISIMSLSIVEPILVKSFEIITQITIPKPDRLPSRLMIYPFSLILIFSALGFDDLFKNVPERKAHLLKLTILLVLFIVLMKHSYMWSVAQTESHYIKPYFENRHLFKSVILDIKGDNYYKNVVIISYLISFVAFIIIYFSYLINTKIEYKKIKR